MKRRSTSLIKLISPFLVLTLTPAATAANILTIADVGAWDRGSGAANGTGNGGILRITSDYTGMTLVDPADPSTWTDVQAWPNDFQGQDTNSASLTDNLWIVFDLGAATTGLDEMFLWNVSEATGWTRGISTFNLYHSLTPTVAVPGWAGSNNLSDGAANVRNYDFQSGGWTQLGGTLNLDRGAESEAGAGQSTVDGIYDLSSIASARYIGIEIVSTHGGAPVSGGSTGNRAGLGQAVFTQVPEPSASVLAALGCLAFFRRKR